MNSDLMEKTRRSTEPSTDLSKDSNIPSLSLEIISERAVPNNIPFEKFSLGFYRSRVEINTTRLSSKEYGLVLTFIGEKAKDNSLVSRFHIELKESASESAVKQYYQDKINNGFYDKKLKQILDMVIRQQKASKRSSGKTVKEVVS